MIKKYHSELLNIFYKIPLSKALDMHYILSQFTLITTQLNILLSHISLENLNEFIKDSIAEILSSTEQLDSWKKVTVPKMTLKSYEVKVKKK